MSESVAGLDPTRVAIGAWSGGRYMHYGEALDEERFHALLAPDRLIRTVITADVYGNGEADKHVGAALASVVGQPGHLTREEVCVVGAVGHDFYTGQRDGPRGYPRFTDPGLRGPDQYGSYLRMATERSLERCGLDHFDLLLLHNPDRTGYTSEVVWDGMQTLKDSGLTRLIGVAPGPANGFTLDMIDCFERFGDRIDWGMVILNPLEPWPGELCLDAAAANGVKLITRVVDYGGLFFDDVVPGQQLAEGDHRAFRPGDWIEAGRHRMQAMRHIADRSGLTMIQLACQWNLSHEAIETVVPTLIQEAGPGARPVEEKRAELAALPDEQLLSDADLGEIRLLGDNTGCMALKGANPSFEGDERADSWGLNQQLLDVAQRWQIEPERDLMKA